MNLDLLKGASGTMLPGTRFNQDKTRLCMPTSSGLACYRGMNGEKNEWHGTFVGIADDEETAQRFLDGAFVQLRSVG